MNALSFAGGRDANSQTVSHAAARELDALVRETMATSTARQALLLRLSALPRELAQPHHLRLAQQALEPLGIADRARLFILPNSDTVMVWRGDAVEPLIATRRALRHLFADEPRALADPDRLIRHLHLPEDGELLLGTIAASLQPPAPPRMPSPPLTPLDPDSLAALEAALARADLSRFARRRAVCARLPDGGYRLAWEKRVFSLGELAETLAPDRDLKTAPWLFRRLTRTLDRRMMALLGAAHELRDVGPFGLVLNVATILSPDFLRFDAALPQRLRGQVVLELTPTDVLADPAAFMFAQGFARARGYRLLLGGITAELAGLFPWNPQIFDLIQLAWSPALAHIQPASIGALPKCLVLAAANAPEALDWAMANGIMLHQGTAVLPTRRATPGSPQGDAVLSRLLR